MKKVSILTALFLVIFVGMAFSQHNHRNTGINEKH